MNLNYNALFALIMPRAPRDEEFDADVIDMKKE